MNSQDEDARLAVWSRPSADVPGPPRTEPWTVPELVGALRDIGVRPGDVLLVHGALRSVGRLARGARDVLDALLEAVGPAGTLVMPAFTEENSDTSWAFQRATTGFSASEKEAFKRAMPAFDPVWTPASPTMGGLAELLRRTPGAVRSSHPQSSFVAIGLLAETILRHHNPASHFGEHSPLARLYALPDTKVLMLGTAFSTFTAFHLAEYLQPTLAARTYRCVIPDGLGRAMWFTYEDVTLDLRDFERIGLEMLDHVATGHGFVGSADTRLVPLIPAVGFGADWMARHRVDGVAAVA
ncbi:aminoglycoside N(3)-acetyltransferase [Yinghuangia soli]|uniref:Aminoglycoside N(3)-acetyltransferase n=1 Tax=Yinghuangia soli TaxID=2908204 RepID=A0AA41PVY8_9ACTN|nr:AAC(3) family N-acetyltransferase [Yinghuangia soli]MCF2526706.1 AAC(3) family N-acetyltransferase [Yinghuangia soli]